MLEILWKNYFFTLIQSNFFQSNARVTFSEQLVLQSSSFFEEVLFRTVTFSQDLFFRTATFFRPKLLPSNHILRIRNFLAQLPFETATYRRAAFSKQILLHNKNFFKKVKFWKNLLFQKSNIYCALPTFSGRLPSIAATFSEELLFYNIPFQKSY